MSAYSSMVFSVETTQKLFNYRQTRIAEFISSAYAELQACKSDESQSDWRTSIRHRVKIQEHLANISLLVAQAMEPRWKALITTIGTDSDDERLDKEVKLFLASRVTSFLHLVLAQLKNLSVSVTMGLLLILLAVSSYPFQPREGLLLFSWIAVLTVVAITLVILVQMRRDKVMSLLSGTIPGELNWSWDFFMKIMLYVVAPVLALLGAQFPGVVGRMISWLSMWQGGHP